MRKRAYLIFKSFQLIFSLPTLRFYFIIFLGLNNLTSYISRITISFVSELYASSSRWFAELCPHIAMLFSVGIENLVP